jgi:hypothetical protein
MDHDRYDTTLDGRGVLHTLEMNARGEADVDTYTASGEGRLERNVYPPKPPDKPKPNKCGGN